MTDRLLKVGCAALAAVAIGGCGSADLAREDAEAVAPATTPAEAMQDPTAPSEPPQPSPGPVPAAQPAAQLVTPGKLDALLVPVEQLNDVVGAKLGFEQQFTKPGSPAGGLGDKAVCAVLFGSNSDTYANQFTAFRRRSVRDGEVSSQHFVAQEVAGFADVAAAQQNFAKAFDKDALDGCNGVTVHRQGDDDRITWKLEVAAVTADTARWTLAQLSDGKPNDWVCAHEARTKSNVALTVTVCQFGNGAPAATAIGNRMTSWIPQP